MIELSVGPSWASQLFSEDPFRLSTEKRPMISPADHLIWRRKSMAGPLAKQLEPIRMRADRYLGLCAATKPDIPLRR